jgi:hypothetical protein
VGSKSPLNFNGFPAFRNLLQIRAEKKLQAFDRHDGQTGSHSEQVPQLGRAPEAVTSKSTNSLQTGINLNSWWSCQEPGEEAL